MNTMLFIMLAQAGEVVPEVPVSGGLEVPAALVGVVPVLAVLLQLLKQIPVIGKYRAYFPILAAVLGGVAGLLLLPDEPNILVRILGGVAAGLASSGAFSTVKSLGTVVKSNSG